MQNLIRKDKKSRQFLKISETKRFVLKNLSKNDNFSSFVKWKALLTLSEMLKRGSFTVFCNRCIITGRRKRINSLYSFSRIVFLKLVRFGHLGGMKKASWQVMNPSFNVLIVQRFRTLPFHGSNAGSIPVKDIPVQER